MTNNETTACDASQPDLVADLVQIISEKSPIHYKYIDKILPRITKQEFCYLNSYLSFCTTQGQSITYMADCYLVLVTDAMNELMYFSEHGTYRYSTFKEVADLVYFNKEYMSQYMHGLAISLVFWTSHLEIHRFFQRVLPKVKRGNYLEIGPGHGAFMMKAMQESAYDHFHGIDISETSIAQTRAILRQFIPEFEKNCSLAVQDFLSSDMQDCGFDAVIMGEVLEHVEDPASFLNKIHKIAKDDAFIFVTTCVNAPQLDHIYLFRTLDEIAEMIRAARFEIVATDAVPYEGKDLEKCVQQRLPINVAYVLAKQG